MNSSQQDTSNIRQWNKYTRAEIEAAIDKARARHPDVIHLTIILKLRTTHEKRHVLDVTQKRVTTMKAEVTERFFDDLERITNRETDMRFISQVLAFVTNIHPATEQIAHAAAQLERDLWQLYGQAISTRFVQSIIARTAEAEAADHHHAGWVLLQQSLERWYAEHPNKDTEKTLQKARDAVRNVSQKTEQGEVRTTEPRYTREALAQIRVAIILRKALEARHASQEQAISVAALADLAVQHADDNEQYSRIIKAIHRRSTERGNRPLIRTIEAAVTFHLGTAGQTTNALEDLRDWLLRLEADVLRDIQRARRTRIPLESAQGVIPLVLRILTILTVPDPKTDAEGSRILRGALEQWHASMVDNASERLNLFTTEERRFLPTRDTSLRSLDTQADRMRAFAILFWRFLETACRCSTDVVLLASMAESAVRQLSDTAQHMGDILSRCYGTVCSAYKYPLSGHLRHAVFAERGENIIGWCQLVIDYKRERNKAIPDNLPPRQAKHEPKNVEPLFMFARAKRRRITHCDALYFIWLHEHEGYQAVVRQTVPVGYDVGKTLGNPDPSRRRKRRGTKMRGRRRTIMGRGYVGKRGARRMKKWLLPPDKRDEAIEDLTVLLYPRLYSKERREQARQKHHPYWVKRQKRGVRAVRPSQHHSQTSTRPLRYHEMSHQQRVQFREQLREQARHAEAFRAFEQALDRFLEPAPPAPPYIEPALLTEQEIAALPPDAQIDPPMSFEARREVYERNLRWFADVIPSGSSHADAHTEEKLFDVETMAVRDLEISAAELLHGHLQPIRFTRAMDVKLSNKTFGLLSYVRERDGYKDYQYIVVCELVGDTADERTWLAHKDAERTAKHGENYFVNWPTECFKRPAKTSMQFFAVEMGRDHQGRILRDFIDWRLREPDSGHTIAKVDLISERDTAGRVDWFAHLSVPVQTPPCDRPIQEMIGFHEYEGQYFFARIDLDGQVVAFGEITLPEAVTPNTADGMTNDNFAFETAVRMVRQSIRQDDAAGSEGGVRTYGAFIGIEDTGWKRTRVDIDAATNRQHVSIPRERIIHLVTYKAAMEGMPPPRVVKGVAPSRDCGQCGYRIEGDTGVHRRPVTHCFACAACHRAHTLTAVTDEEDNECWQCSTCGRIWQQQEPQYRCRRCGYQQHARYNAALVTVKRTLQQLVEGNEKEEEDVEGEQDTA